MSLLAVRVRFKMHYKPVHGNQGASKEGLRCRGESRALHDTDTGYISTSSLIVTGRRVARV